MKCCCDFFTVLFQFVFQLSTFNCDEKQTLVIALMSFCRYILEVMTIEISVLVQGVFCKVQLYIDAFIQVLPEQKQWFLEVAHACRRTERVCSSSLSFPCGPLQKFHAVFSDTDSRSHGCFLLLNARCETFPLSFNRVISELIFSK